MTKSVYVLPGDNIGPEIISEGVKVLEVVNERLDLDIDIHYGLLGGAALETRILGRRSFSATAAAALASCVRAGSQGGTLSGALERPRGRR